MKSVTEQELQALVSLLDDGNAKDQETLGRHILKIGKPAVPHLEAYCAGAEPRLRQRIEGLLQGIRLQDLKAEFHSLASGRGPSLERGAFLISRFGYPHLA